MHCELFDVLGLRMEISSGYNPAYLQVFFMSIDVHCPIQINKINLKLIVKLSLARCMLLKSCYVLSCTHLGNDAFRLQCDTVFTQVKKYNRNLAASFKRNVYQSCFKEHPYRQTMVFKWHNHQCVFLVVLFWSDVTHDAALLFCRYSDGIPVM